MPIELLISIYCSTPSSHEWVDLAKMALSATFGSILTFAVTMFFHKWQTRKDKIKVAIEKLIHAAALLRKYQAEISNFLKAHFTLVKNTQGITSQQSLEKAYERISSLDRLVTSSEIEIILTVYGNGLVEEFKSIDQQIIDITECILKDQTTDINALYNGIISKEVNIGTLIATFQAKLFKHVKELNKKL